MRMSRSTINYFVKYQFVGYSISTNFYKRQDSAYIYIYIYVLHVEQESANVNLGYIDFQIE